MSTKINDRDFYRGFAVAVGTLARNGYPSHAIDIMNCNGITLDQLKSAGVDEFDIRPIRKEWKQSARQREVPR